MNCSVAKISSERYLNLDLVEEMDECDVCLSFSDKTKRGDISGPKIEIISGEDIQVDVQKILPTSNDRHLSSCLQ